MIGPTHTGFSPQGTTHMKKSSFALLVAAGLMLAPTASRALAEDKVDFPKQIAPIFKETCYSCHGAEKQKGKLRLDSPEAFKKGGADGEILTAGDPAKSDLYRRITLP